MNPVLPMLVYGSALALAFLILFVFQARHWYWHVLSVLVAVCLGLVRFPENWHGPAFDLFIGFWFVFLLVWGIGAPFFRPERLPRHA